MYLVLFSLYRMAVFSTNLDTGAELGKTTFLLGFAEMSPMVVERRKPIECENDFKAASMEDVS